MKATEQYFPVVLFITLYRVVLTFESGDETPKCDLSNLALCQYFRVVLLSVFSIKQNKHLVFFLMI